MEGTACGFPHLGPAEVRVAPSILAADFGRLAEEIAAVAGATDWLHLDVMDGHFVPNISLGVPVVASVRRHTSLFLDCHLMISEPARYIEAFAEAGAGGCSVHLEAGGTAGQLGKLRQLGLAAGLALNPETPIEKAYGYLESLDYLVVMSVHPGFGGQQFIWESVDKVEKAASEIDRLGLDVTVQVDGGIDAETAVAMARAGARCFVAGSAVFNDPRPLEAAHAIAEAAGREAGERKKTR